MYHASPYTHVPATFPHDPLLVWAGHGWSHVPSVYGPLFTGVSSLASFALGTAVLPTRLFYQSLAVAALATACVIIWRRTRSAGAVAFLAFNPVVALYLVNGGRNDIIVGVALLAAVVLASRERDTAAGIVLGLGVLIKLTGVVGLVALVASTYVARGRRPASKTAFASVGVVVLGYAVAGTAALFTPLDTAGARFSAGSLWRLLPRLGRSLPSTHLVLAVLAVLVLVVITRSARRGPAIAVTAAVATLSAGAAYTLAGYVGWALPTAALDHESRVARLAAAEAVLLVAVYQVLRHPFPGWLGTSLMNVAEIGGPLGMLVILVLLVRAARPRADDESDTSPDGRLTWAREPRTLVVIPTLDERANIEAVLRGTRAALPDAHVLVVDDGSRDGTPEAATALGRELGGIDVVRRVGERGLGSAYRAGFAAGLADGYDVLVEMDADLSHDPHALPSLVDGVRAGADLVIGSRYVRGGATPGWSPKRRALSRGGCWYARHMLTLPVRDATSGFRAYRADALRRIDLTTVEASGYGFQIEMAYRIARGGGTIIEVPIVFRDRVAGTSKMSMAIVVEALALVTRWGIHDRSRRLPPPVAVPPGFSAVRQGGGDPTPEAA